MNEFITKLFPHISLAGGYCIFFGAIAFLIALVVVICVLCCKKGKTQNAQTEETKEEPTKESEQ